MEKKIGVYLCSGCGIGDALDLEGLSKVATGEYSLEICKTHHSLCSEGGLAIIREDMEEEALTSLVIGACSPRVLTDVFVFPDDVFVERVNLREQVVWCLEPGDEDTQMVAEDYLRMGIVRVQKADVPEPYREEIDKTILVVGGGVTGMTAALEAARAGYPVVLVEKEEALGGFLRKIYRQFPHEPPFEGLQPVNLDKLVSEVESEGRIRVLLGMEIERIEGAPGMFDVVVRGVGGGVEESFRVGAIVQATGWRPYDASKLGHLGYGRVADVVTSVELEEMVLRGEFVRPSDGRAPKSVVFIQCAGSRDPEHLPYCSSVCCMVSLKQALYFKEKQQETEVYILYKDIRTPGQYEEFYRRAQKEGIVFIKGDVQGVNSNGGKVAVEVQDVLLGETLQLEVDLVVLAVGMVSSMVLGGEDVVLLGEEVVVGSGEGEGGGSGEGSGDEGEVLVESGRVLRLCYRQGPELPFLRYGMPDSHFICFPYETRRTGIYAAGCVRQPMDVWESMEDGLGAALKAVQCVELVGRGEAVHPRSGDRSYPELFMQRCTQCKRCTEECPFGMYNEDEKANPLPNPTRCRRCGVCMGSCPERIISFRDYSVDMIGSMIKAIEVPDEDEEKPRVLVFACENDAYPALDMLGFRGGRLSPYVRVISLRCLGSLNLVWIADALSKGIDGVLLLGCRHGEDYQCHFVKGSELASYRLGKISETLDRLALESERVHMEQVEITDYGRLPQIVESFMERIEEIGPNPYKGF